MALSIRSSLSIKPQVKKGEHKAEIPRRVKISSNNLNDESDSVSYGQAIQTILALHEVQNISASFGTKERGFDQKVPRDVKTVISRVVIFFIHLIQ